MKKQFRREDVVLRRHERTGQPGRFHVVVCDGCGRTLHKTHHVALYGNLCRPCWLIGQGGEGANDVGHDASAFSLN